MTFKEYFLLEYTNPDELYHLQDKSVITFSLIPQVGYIWTNASNTNGDYFKISHHEMYQHFPGQLTGKNVLKTGYGVQAKYVKFYCKPGVAMSTLIDAVKHLRLTLNVNSTAIEGRLYKDNVTFWQAKSILKDSEIKSLFDKFCQQANVDSHTLKYSFSNAAEITYQQVFDDNVVVDKKRQTDMERLRQIHLNPELKKATIPNNLKANNIANQQGFTSIAQMNNRKIVGDSLSI